MADSVRRGQAGRSRDLGPLDDRPQGRARAARSGRSACIGSTRASTSPTRPVIRGMLRRVAFLIEVAGTGWRRSRRKGRRSEAPRSAPDRRARASRRVASAAAMARAAGRPRAAARRARSHVPAETSGLVRGRPDAAPHPHAEAPRLPQPRPGRVRAAQPGDGSATSSAGTLVTPDVLRHDGPDPTTRSCR